MIRLILKLALAALVANAAWRVGVAYASFYKFKDSVHQTAQFGGDKSEDQLRARVLELAAEYDLPIAEDSFIVRLREERILIDGSFKKEVEIFPGYRYPWPFTWSIETLTIRSAPPRPLQPR